MSVQKRLIVYIISLLFACSVIIAGAVYFVFPLYKDLRQPASVSGALNGVVFVIITAGALILLCALVCTFVTSLLVIRDILPRLRALGRLAAEIREGNLDCRIEYAHGDEFEPVFREFDAMREKLKNSLTETAAIEQNRRVLIASLAHDIKTPITAICGYAEGLRDGIAEDAGRRRRYIETILQKAQLVDSLASDLFLFSKLEIGQVSLAMEAVNAAAFLTGVFQEAARTEAYTLTFEAAGLEDQTLMINATAFARIIQNITQNSVRHAGAENLVIQVSARIGENSVHIKIADNGAGMPAEDCDRVFDDFYRADTARSGSGSGLGLSICRRLIEAMNGKIWARSGRSGGFSVYIMLPLRPKE